MNGTYDPRQQDPSQSRRPHLRRDDAWIEALLSRERIARIATLWQGEDGAAFPFITPLAYVYRPEEHDLIYHTNIVGRLHANTAQGHPATAEVSEIGRFLPSNSPLELSVQYRSVVVFGTAHILHDPDEQRRALTRLSEQVFPGLKVGETTRPIQEADLRRTRVYRLAITHWSGKENWAPRAAQEEGWPPLAPEWFGDMPGGGN